MRAKPHALARAYIGVVNAGDLDLYQHLAHSRLRRLNILEAQHFGAAWLVYPYRFHLILPVFSS